MTVIAVFFVRKSRAVLRRSTPHDALPAANKESSAMDPYRFGYSPVVERPKLSWPNGARVAVGSAPTSSITNTFRPRSGCAIPWPRMPHPDVLGYGGRDYGNRVGLWRMFEVLGQAHVRCTVSLSMSVIEMYPEILDAMEARRWEYMSHGYFNTRYHWGYGEQEEREVIEHSKATHLR
jgi:Predicted xylanase/chitin deacetylase